MLCLGAISSIGGSGLCSGLNPLVKVNAFIIILHKFAALVDDFTGMIYGHYNLDSPLISQLGYLFIRIQKYK